MKKLRVKKERNFKNTIPVVVITLVIILMIFGVLALYLSPESSKNRYKYEVMGVYKPENYVEPETVTKSIKFVNAEELNNFRGNLPVSTGMKTIKLLLTDIIPVYLEKTKDLSKDELKIYYANNANVILNELHISSESSFVNMIEKFRNIDLELNVENIDRCELSYDMSVKLLIVFKNNHSIEVDMLGKTIETFYLEY